MAREYHTAIGEIIIKHSGTLEHYAGDGVMVFFNDPIPVQNPALQAVQTAIDMRTAIGALTEKWRRLGHERLVLASVLRTDLRRSVFRLCRHRNGV
jgi:adenylate cyclase